eukprot:6212512-Pleurochrysis_carterae.AAC.1
MRNGACRHAARFAPFNCETRFLEDVPYTFSVASALCLASSVAPSLATTTAAVAAAATTSTRTTTTATTSTVTAAIAASTAVATIATQIHRPEERVAREREEEVQRACIVQRCVALARFDLPRLTWSPKSTPNHASWLSE